MMQLSATISYLKSLDDWTWLCELCEQDRRVFTGGQQPVDGTVSIVSVCDPRVDHSGKTITFFLSGARVLINGSSDECLFVNKSHRCRITPTDENHVLGQAQHLASIAGSGDAMFIASCKAEALPAETVALAADFLARIREFSDDTLVEGLNRKWVTKPNNFLAITIQNRNKQYCVHVKKTAILTSLKNVLEVRDDRPGYARFWLSRREQLNAAVTAARASFG